jgi:hypothetical protein
VAMLYCSMRSSLARPCMRVSNRHVQAVQAGCQACKRLWRDWLQASRPNSSRAPHLGLSIRHEVDAGVDAAASREAGHSHPEASLGILGQPALVAGAQAARVDHVLAPHNRTPRMRRRVHPAAQRSKAQHTRRRGPAILRSHWQSAQRSVPVAVKGHAAAVHIKAHQHLCRTAVQPQHHLCRTRPAVSARTQLHWQCCHCWWTHTRAHTP